LKEFSNVLFCGAFNGETDLLNKIQGINVYDVGIGLHDSLFNLQRYFYKNPDRFKSIVFVGSAGSYDSDRLNIGDIVYSYKFLCKDLSEIKGLAKTPDVFTKHVLSIPDVESLKMVQKLGFVETISNSMNYVTTTNLSNEERLEHLFDVGAENMEAFSLAYVANRLSIGFLAIYYITNLVGKDGSIDWNKNWREGSNVLQSKIINYLKAKKK
jgi:nucleoside phosphorylase